MSRFEPFLKPCLHEQTIKIVEGESYLDGIVNLEVSPTGKCNANCSWCFYRGEKTGDELDFEQFKEFVYWLDPGPKAISWTGGGEPSLHPQFKEMVDWTNEKGFKQGIFTNGMAQINYDPSKMEWIRISFTHLLDQLDHKISNNMRKLRKCKTVGIAVNYDGVNDEPIYKALKIADKYNFDYVQVRPILNTKGETTDIEPPNIKHRKLIITDYKFDEARKKHEYDNCYGHGLCPFVWENGDVDVCGYMRGIEGYNLGNISNPEKTSMNYHKMHRVPVCSTCQVCCKNHETNKLINKLIKIKDKDFV